MFKSILENVTFNGLSTVTLLPPFGETHVLRLFDNKKNTDILLRLNRVLRIGRSYNHLPEVAEAVVYTHI